MKYLQPQTWIPCPPFVEFISSSLSGIKKMPPILWGSNVCKSMVILRDLLLMLHCLGLVSSLMTPDFSKKPTVFSGCVSSWANEMLGWPFSLLNDEQRVATRCGWFTPTRSSNSKSHLSNEKNPGCLVYIGDYTTQLYRDYHKPL